MSIIHGASKSGDIRAVRAALVRGADVNEPDKHGRPPIIHAVQQGHTEIVELLLDNGADVNAACIGSSDALSGEVGLTALIMAAWTGRTETVKLLITRGANVSAVADGGNTPLRAATCNKWSEIVELLRDAGAVK